MPAIVAEPITNETVQAAAAPAVDTWMRINPWFDWQVLFGIPFWVFVGAFLVLAFLVVNLYWFFRIRKLSAVRGYVDAKKMATQEDVMVWIISTTKNLTIECLKKRDTVLSFYDPSNITKWVHTARSAVLHIGGIGGVLVSEDFYKTRDMVSEMAICNACDRFNENQGMYIEELNSMGLNGSAVNPIKNYEDYENYGRDILESIHPDGLVIPAYCIYDPDKFKKYFPAGLTATFNGGIIVRKARKLNLGNKAQSLLEKYLPLGLIVSFIIIGIVAAWMVNL